MIDEWDGEGWDEDGHRGRAVLRSPVVRTIVLIDIVLRVIAATVAWRARQRRWFAALLVVNSAGILPALYLLRFRRKRGPASGSP
jgi:hypothetical protein